MQLRTAIINTIMAIDISKLFTNPQAVINEMKAGRKVPKLSGKMPGKGSIVMFRYDFARPGHDQNPLVLVTDYQYRTVRSDQVYLRGLNLHKLTDQDIMYLLGKKRGLNACNNPNFSYNNISGNKYIVTAAFRQYRWVGIKRLQTLNCDYILNAMGSVRALDPQELAAIQQATQEQLARIVNQPLV